MRDEARAALRRGRGDVRDEALQAGALRQAARSRQRRAIVVGVEVSVTKHISSSVVTPKWTGWSSGLFHSQVNRMPSPAG